MDFLKWYKNRVESGNLEPPEAVWENVQDQLDIDHSWQAINNYLEHKAAIKRKYWLSAAAGILIFIMAGGYWWVSSDNMNLEKQVAENVTVVDDQSTEKTENQENENISVVKDKDDVLIAEKTNIQDARNESESLVAENNLSQLKDQETENSIEGSNSEDNFLIAELIPYNLKINDFSELGAIVPAFADLNKIDDEQDKKRTAFQKFYAGATGQLANTWLLNEKTYTGLESTSLTASNASFGSNFGFFAGSNITENLFVQLDINVLTQNRQDYNEYLYGEYISNEMKFNYSQLGISLRYIAFSNRYMKGEHNIYAGGYWGYLHSAYQIVNQDARNITDNYSQSDYGMFLGYEYVFPIYKNLGFGTGVKATYGLSNIYSGDNYIPSYLNKTHNASLNITFSLKYSLK